ncbi:MAG TPA: chromosome segregation protein SMC [Candidatus Limnocylindria bacterium]
MSRLKELRLHGFKSFAEPTRFVFEPGVTAIIGPNGSGKSNMADAIRWVLGEQSNRSLRTRRSDDVIFAGSESRKPIGMAEVVLTFDNHDGWLPIEFEEVTVARRAYRSGDPEYLINGSRARLKDVVELLAGGRLGANELVVVGQGTVDAALSLRPEERRQLFEEAAGVKGLQVRRNEALAKLGKARDNLTRVSDVVRELRPQVKRLALQAEHQEAHDKLGLRARALVLEHHARRAQALQTSLGEARRRGAALTEDLEAERTALATGRQAVRDAEERYWAAEAESRTTGTTWESAREAVIRAESRHDSLVERDLDLTAEAERAQRELAELTEAEDLPETGGGASPAGRTDAAVAEDAWRAAADRSRTASAEVLAAEEALAGIRLREADRLADAGRWAEEAAAGRVRRDNLERERAALEARLVEANARAAQIAADRGAAAETETQAEAAADAALKRRAAAEEAVGRTAVAVAELSERHARAGAELAELQAARSDAGTDLVDRLRSDGWTTPEALGAIPAEAGAAMAAVLGDVERALAWKPGADAAVAETAGDAYLLAPANGRPGGRTEALAAVRASQTLAELVDGGTAPEILQRTAVAPDLAALLAGWHDLPDGWAAVTLDGDLADARGVVTVRGRAGGTSPGRSRASRVAELAQLVERLAGEITLTQEQHRDAAAELDRAGIAADAALAAVEASRVSRRRADEDGILAEATLAHLAAERDRVATAIGELPASDPEPPPPAQLAEQITRLEAAAAQARTRQAAADAERDEAREAWQAAVRVADEHDAASGDRRASAARTAERGEQVRRTLASLDAERSALATTLAAAATALAEARSAETAIAEQRAANDEARETPRQALLDAERRLSSGGGRLTELEAQLHQVAVDVSRLEEALAGLERERELSLEGLPEPDPALEAPEPGAAAPDEIAPAALAEDDLAEELRRTRRTLHQIGSVNPFAIEEHRELSTRLDELSVQETDLKGATDATQELIDRLDGEISQQFQAAFAAIGQKFDEYCRLLFAGGSASLELGDDAESEAPGGIEIAVRPPGKRLQRLAMLSGGERALAGVALLFAMLTVNPVPFCVLDEVDAALDEANIGRFADALRRLSETIDFVVITHNRATIETADTIYGVTMTDAAVSRVLSLRLADVPVEVSA